MSLSVTFNGTLGRSSSSQARRVVATLGVATGECDADKYEKHFIRKNALDGTPDTTLPISIDIPYTLVKSLVVRSVNSATLQMTYTPEIGTPQVVPLVLGDDSHPEGLLTLFGQFSGLSLEITEVGADGTEVEIWAAGV